MHTIVNPISDRQVALTMNSDTTLMTSHNATLNPIRAGTNITTVHLSKNTELGIEGVLLAMKIAQSSSKITTLGLAGVGLTDHHTRDMSELIKGSKIKILDLRTVCVFGEFCALEGAIVSDAGSLEALPCVRPMAFLSGPY
jgi:hypothetical protein